MGWKGRDVVSSSEIGRKEIEEILKEAEKLEHVAKKKGRTTELQGKILASLFYEPSTRTQMSFSVAMQRLGGEVTGFSNPKSSSVVKGESLSDTIKAVEPAADAIVIRHPSEGAARLAADATEVPVINAGDGNNQHPTQALLDVYTIKKNKKKVDGLTVLMAGDLKYGRTVHSLSYALANFDDVTLQYYSPQQLRMPQHILADLRDSVKVEELHKFDVGKADVIYATRIQKERIADAEEYAKAAYVIDSETMAGAKKDAMLMHPLPRVDEIATEVDADPRAKYFEQEANGIPVRMALLKLILKG